MLSKNKAIVLSKVKYNDNDVILKCYTAERGLVSYLVRGAYNNSKSKASKMGYFQVLSQLQIEEEQVLTALVNMVKALPASLAGHR